MVSFGLVTKIKKKHIGAFIRATLSCFMFVYEGSSLNLSNHIKTIQPLWPEWRKSSYREKSGDLLMLPADRAAQSISNGLPCCLFVCTHHLTGRDSTLWSQHTGVKITRMFSKNKVWNEAVNTGRPLDKIQSLYSCRGEWMRMRTECPLTEYLIWNILCHKKSVQWYATCLN